jgi:hypothetical protein
MTGIAAGPAIGSWYRHLDKGEVFQVVGFDERSRTIEIQAFDGDIDEIEEEVWNTLPIVQIEPPEDSSGPIDDLDRDDASNLDSKSTPVQWMQPFDLKSLEELDERADNDGEPDDENGDRAAPS